MLLLELVEERPRDTLDIEASPNATSDVDEGDRLLLFELENDIPEPQDQRLTRLRARVAMFEEPRSAMGSVHPLPDLPSEGGIAEDDQVLVMNSTDLLLHTSTSYPVRNWQPIRHRERIDDEPAFVGNRLERKAGAVKINLELRRKVVPAEFLNEQALELEIMDEISGA